LSGKVRDCPHEDWRPALSRNARKSLRRVME
jgi:hypothetical protein